MGRKPNQILAKYFRRGNKLSDQSNRYQQVCCMCHQEFPKGRPDTMMTHITRDCHAMSAELRAQLQTELAGHKARRARVSTATQSQPQFQGPPGALGLLANQNMPSSPLAAAPVQQQQANGTSWTGLEALAEASRQVDLTAKYDGRGKILGLGDALMGDVSYDSPDQFLNHSPSLYPKEESHLNTHVAGDMTAEEQVAAFLDPAAMDEEASNARVVAAASAHLSDSMLDPQFSLEHDLKQALDPDSPAEPATRKDPVERLVQGQSTSLTAVVETAEMGNVTHDEATAPTSLVVDADVTASEQAWGQITRPPSPHVSSAVGDSPAQTATGSPLVMIAMASPAPGVTPDVLTPAPPAKGGDLVNVNGTGSATRGRSRFEPDRRQEVREMRGVGACMRCKILRKPCSAGTPCDPCRKVLHPRVWQSSCLRTKLPDDVTLFATQIHMITSKRNVELIKERLRLGPRKVTVEGQLPHVRGASLLLDVTVAALTEEEHEDLLDNLDGHPVSDQQSHLAFTEDNKLIEAKVEGYMKRSLPEFVHKEANHFTRTTLCTALTLLTSSGSELLRMALELWTYLDMIDSCTEWVLAVLPNLSSIPARALDATHDVQICNTLRYQLNGAAERKLSLISKTLLRSLQRVLQDAKTEVNHVAYFTCLVLLICIEKYTWVYKAWEGETVKDGWPLVKPPSVFTSQGEVAAKILRALCDARKIMPPVKAGEEDVLMVENANEVVKTYFETINLKADEVRSKQRSPTFSAFDTRSLELAYSSSLLLPAVKHTET